MALTESLLSQLALEALQAEKSPVDFWRSLPPSRRYAVASTYFTVAVAPLTPDGLTLDHFLEQIVARLLQGLSRRTRREEVTYSGRVRGTINWPATFKARHGRDYDPTRFVCRELRYEYDTMENQLLRFFVQRLVESIHLVPDSIRRGEWFAIGRNESISIADRMNRLESRLTEQLRHVHFREVTLPTHITPEHLLRAGTSRTEEYGAVATLYRQYVAIVRNGEWSSTRRLLRTGLVLPAGTEPLWDGVNVAVLRA